MRVDKLIGAINYHLLSDDDCAADRVVIIKADYGYLGSSLSDETITYLIESDNVDRYDTINGIMILKFEFDDEIDILKLCKQKGVEVCLVTPLKKSK